MRETALLAEINFHSVPAPSCSFIRSFLISSASPPLCTSSRRTGKSPASCRFDSNNSCDCSSVRSGEARKVTVPTFMLAAVAGMGGISLTGLTLKSELVQAAVQRIARHPRASEAAFRKFGNIARFPQGWKGLAGDLNHITGGGHAGADGMQLGRVNHVQASIAHSLKAG